jgi:mono/diheme cytochrome c family protein
LVHPIPLPAEASGIVIRDRTAYVTTNEPAGRLLQIDLDSRRIERSWRVGHMPTAPHVSLDGRTVFLANRFENRVRSVELSTGVQSCVEVIREPVAIVLGASGRHLFVANHLPHVRPFLDDGNPTMYAEISVIDVEAMQTVRTIELANGSQSLRGIALSPDGDYVVVTHVLSNFVLPTMAVAGGAMNRNALSLIRTRSLDLLATMILDDPDRGAANPWAVCFTNDGESLLVSHAGTHEISVINWPALLERAAARSSVADLFDQDSLTAMSGIRRRIELPLDGPRALCEVGGTVYVAGFFSDNLAAVDLRREPPAVRAIELQPRTPPSLARRGEQYFNDARLCFQQWQSCATCHPDGRADALYWDLLNDGIGNTKNTKSLLMAPLTPPAMSRGVRADAGMAVASGIRHIQFSEPSDEQAEAIEEYLLEMKAVPSPLLNADVLESPKTDAASCAKCHYPGVLRGTLTESARRGKTLFEGQAGCFTCHPHPHYTSMQTVDAGLGTGVKYDIPSLVEAWRTAPYLHHGDALSLEETVTDYNHLQMRGKTESLTEAELSDLLEYLRSL